MVPAAFQDIGEADQIGLDIGVRVAERMTHAGLRGEMHDEGKAARGEQLLHAGAIGEVAFDEFEAGQFGEFGEPRLFQLRIVIGVHVVEPDHRPAVAQQPPREVEADETGRAGDQNGLYSRHGSIPPTRARSASV